MKLLFSGVVAACLALGSLTAHAQLARQACPGASSLCNPVPAATAGCAQATNFLARATGMDATHQTAFTTMICGLVTDGIITGTMAGSATSGPTACGSLIDVLYIYATDTSPHALLNLCSTAFTGNIISAPTFTADAGFFGSGPSMIGTGGTGTSGYLPSTAGGNFTQNSASIGNWSFTAAQDANATMGSDDVGATNVVYIFDQFTDGKAYCVMNDNASTFANGTVTSGAGFFLCNRSGANATQLYRNAVALTPGSQASQGLNSGRSLYMNGDQTASPVASNRQIAMAMIGGSLTSGQVTSINTRVCTYLTTVHGSC